MLKDDKRDVWLAFLEKILALKTIVDNVKKYARVFTRSRPVILQEPEDVSGPINSSCYYEVIAENARAYAWQREKNGTWSFLSLETARTSKLEFSITEERSRYKYRCRITGIDNTTIYSKEVYMYIEED